MCELKCLTIKNLKEIKDLYNDIKEKTKTVWEKDYPSEELIRWDIERKGLYALVGDDKQIIAIAYAGKRNEDNDKDCKWKLSIKNRGTFARFGVNPKFQRQGYGQKMLQKIFDLLKEQGFDGIRILAEPENTNAVCLYDKLNFIKTGVIKKQGKTYLQYEKLL